MTDETLTMRLDGALATLPLVAILRGLAPADAEGAATVLYEQGFRLIEVPLNSPDPFASIAAIRRVLPHDALVGAGTVTSTAQVDELAALSADLVVMPHADTEVVRAADRAGVVCIPGVASPTEAFAALAAGADALKLFPAELITPRVMAAMRTVLPAGTRLFPVGGITPDTMAPFAQAGAAGFGLGSALYTPGMPLPLLAERAARFAAAWKDLSQD